MRRLLGAVFFTAAMDRSIAPFHRGVVWRDFREQCHFTQTEQFHMMPLASCSNVHTPAADMFFPLSLFSYVIYNWPLGAVR